MRNGDEASPSINLADQALSEYAQNSWTAWYVLKGFGMLMYFNSLQPLVSKMVMRLYRAIFWPVELF